MEDKTWQDTVIPVEERIKMGVWHGRERQAQAQAEISFKAGQREMAELSDELLEIGRKAIEDVLVDWRDNRLSMFNRGNGLVIREKDGRDSSIIRFGPETALRIGMKAIGQAKLKEIEQ